MVLPCAFGFIFSVETLFHIIYIYIFFFFCILNNGEHCTRKRNSTANSMQTQDKWGSVVAEWDITKNENIGDYVIKTQQ